MPGRGARRHCRGGAGLAGACRRLTWPPCLPQPRPCRAVQAPRSAAVQEPQQPATGWHGSRGERGLRAAGVRLGSGGRRGAGACVAVGRTAGALVGGARPCRRCRRRSNGPQWTGALWQPAAGTTGRCRQGAGGRGAGSLRSARPRQRRRGRRTLRRRTSGARPTVRRGGQAWPERRPSIPSWTPDGHGGEALGSDSAISSEEPSLPESGSRSSCARATSCRQLRSLSFRALPTVPCRGGSAPTPGSGGASPSDPAPAPSCPARRAGGPLPAVAQLRCGMTRVRADGSGMAVLVPVTTTRAEAPDVNRHQGRRRQGEQVRETRRRGSDLVHGASPRRVSRCSACLSRSNRFRLRKVSVVVIPVAVKPCIGTTCHPVECSCRDARRYRCRAWKRPSGDAERCCDPLSLRAVARQTVRPSRTRGSSGRPTRRMDQARSGECRCGPTWTRLDRTSPSLAAEAGWLAHGSVSQGSCRRTGCSDLGRRR
jgi:hypothetical protein